MRFVLAELLSGRAVDFDNVDSFIPELKLHARAIPLLVGGGRVIKTHETCREEYRKAIYIVRDIRDVALSTYARDKELGIIDPSFDVFLRSFLRGRVHPYGAWSHHVRSWLDGPLAKEGSLLLVKFEDLKRDPQAIISRIVEFLGMSMPKERILAALSHNSLQEMRRKEKTSKKLAQSMTEEGRFVGQARVQGWKTVLSSRQLQMFEQNAEVELSRVGYPHVWEIDAADSRQASLLVGNRT